MSHLTKLRSLRDISSSVQLRITTNIHEYIDACVHGVMEVYISVKVTT